jgi:hypothetical protein
MFMQNIREAARLNHLGTSLLANNDASGALAAFREAIVIMEATSRTEEAFVALRSPQEKVCWALEMPDLDSVGAFFVYNKPLVFEGSPQVVDLAFFNAVIIYNLALTFHLAASRRGDASKFKKAINFYHLCYDLIASDDTASAGALLIAARNNATHASLQLGEYENFREGLKSLEKDVGRLSARGESIVAFFDASHLQEFFLNITLDQEPIAAATA